MKSNHKDTEDTKSETYFPYLISDFSFSIFKPGEAHASLFRDIGREKTFAFLRKTFAPLRLRTCFERFYR